MKSKMIFVFGYLLIAADFAANALGSELSTGASFGYGCLGAAIVVAAFIQEAYSV
jgi:hypothetical protein